MKRKRGCYFKSRYFLAVLAGPEEGRLFWWIALLNRNSACYSQLKAFEHNACFIVFLDLLVCIKLGRSF